MQRSSAKHETVARGIKIECKARDLSSRRSARTFYHDGTSLILGSGKSALLSNKKRSSRRHHRRHVVPFPYLEILRSSMTKETIVRDSSATLRETIVNIGGFYSNDS